MKLNDKTSAVMSDIVTKVIDAMRDGTAPWQKPWETRGSSDAPTNISTGNYYAGLNRIYLTILSAAYGTDYWIGYGQARDMGAHVRKGEKSTAILAPMLKKIEDTTTGEERRALIGFRIVRVFNVAQCDGIELPATDTQEPRTLNAPLLDTFVANTGADIVTGGDTACYIPSLDQIRMPERDAFTSAGGYYGTLLHELTHWTRHETRLNRKKDISRRGYAFEELVAELGAWLASDLIGCPNESMNHASYLESWLKALDDDHDYLWSAASLAEKAATYLIKLGQTSAEAAATAA